MAVAVAVAVRVCVAVPVAGLTKKFFHQKDFLIKNNKNLQTAEKSRGMLGFLRFLDGLDRRAVIYFSKILRTSERNKAYSHTGHKKFP